MTTLPNTQPSGWYFEFANEFYPDIDDTAQVLLALEPLAQASSRSEQEAVRDARRAVAARHAIERRRLGGVRRR